MTAPLPHAAQAIAGGQPVTIPWRTWFERVNAGLQSGALSGEELAADIATIATALGSPDGSVEGIPPLDDTNLAITGPESVKVLGTPAGGQVTLRLDNDEANPDPLRFYGTDVAGAKGYQPLIAPSYVVVNTKDDFPAAVSGVVTLADNACYLLTGIIDMAGDRIVCGTNNTLIGGSANTCGLLFSGGGSSTWITGTSSLSLRYLQLIAETGTLFSLDNDVTDVLLWTGIRIINTPTIGTIRDYQNVVWKDQIIFNSANLTLDGTFASFVAETALFDGRNGQTTVIVPSTATFLRRFRMLYTAFQVDAGETGINFSTSATVPDQGYILDNVNFAGAGTYIAGYDHTYNVSQFFNCTGITNTTSVVQYSMTGNTTATTISSTSVFVKIAGTTIPSSINQKFDTSVSNRAEYIGSGADTFRATVFASMTSGNNQDLQMRIAVNGTTLASSTARFRTSGSGEASSIGCQATGILSPGDYVEVFVANATAANNITVSDLNLIINRLT